MSQAEFSSSSEVEPMPYQAGQTEQEQSLLQQELHSCNQKCEQAYLLLQQTQEKLDLSQQVMQRQEELAQRFQERIDRLEQDLEERSEQLEQSNAKCDYLRTHLKREQNHTSQLKALLERFLDEEETAPVVAELDFSGNITDAWATSSLEKLEKQVIEYQEQSTAEIAIGQEAAPETELSTEPITQPASGSDLLLDPIEDTVELMLPSLEEPPIDVPAYQSPNQMSDDPTNLVLPQVSIPRFTPVLSTAKKRTEPAPLIDRSNHKVLTSFAAVKLPKFPPLQRR